MYTTTTGAMKNAFGGLLSKYRHYTHTWIHETLVDLLAIQKEIHPGIFAVMDGTTAGNGAGPRMMQPDGQERDPGLRRPGGDRRGGGQADGLRPAEHHATSAWRTSRAWACGDPREIELVGDDVSGENWGFKVGRNSHSFLAWLAWYGPTKVFQKLVLRTPLVVVPTFIGEVEQDYMYWPLKYRAIAKQWRESTEWGALFQKYQRQGVWRLRAGRQRMRTDGNGWERMDKLPDLDAIFEEAKKEAEQPDAKIYGSLFMGTFARPG